MNMRQCPKCKTDMDFCMKYNAGNPIIIWRCIYCGYSSENEVLQTDNKTYIDKNNRLKTIDHTY